MVNKGVNADEDSQKKCQFAGLFSFNDIPPDSSETVPSNKKHSAESVKCCRYIASSLFCAGNASEYTFNSYFSSPADRKGERSTAPPGTRAISF